MKIFEATLRGFDQGGDKRKGSAAIYLAPWHADIDTFLLSCVKTDNSQKTAVDETIACPDLFHALWIPDRFMRAVERDESWYLMCPHECAGLVDAWGAEFDRLYARYVAAGRYRRVVQARDLMDMIARCAITNGRPYVLFADACNRKSNQRNVGSLVMSNLCTEILQYSCSDDQCDDRNEISVCTLANVALGNLMADVLRGERVRARLRAEGFDRHALLASAERTRAFTRARCAATSRPSS